MKNLSLLVTLGLALFLATPPVAFAESPQSASPSLLPEIATLISRCAIRTYTVQDGRKTYGNLRPTCDAVKLDNQKAYFQIDGEWYTATIEEAADSDDGDLDNVYVFDSDGSTVAQRREVPAFGDVLLALSSGRAQLPEIYVQDLDPRPAL